MKQGPSIAPVAALAGDPARANMLAALLSGTALTAGELANEAGVSLATASAHLAKLRAGGLITGIRQGRHHYFRLADADVAALLESLAAIASRAGFTRTRPGPADPALRQARVCYDHLAGEAGVALFDALSAARVIAGGDEVRLTRKGEDFVRGFGIDLDALKSARRPLCKPCLDWSQRRRHLAGSLGAALLDQMIARKWLTRGEGRVLHFSRAGDAAWKRLTRG
jgi:DNA-binding transcriptional ArsR family regulator